VHAYKHVIAKHPPRWTRLVAGPTRGS